MKRALQALLIAPDKIAREAILAGEKQITIREGWRDYVPGPVLLACQIKPWCVMADITNVRHTRLGKVTKEECMADGYENYLEMLKDLRKYYEHLSFSSNVTVIRFDNMRGKLVDDYRKRKGL